MLGPIACGVIELRSGRLYKSIDTNTFIIILIPIYIFYIDTNMKSVVYQLVFYVSITIHAYQLNGGTPVPIADRHFSFFIGIRFIDSNSFRTIETLHFRSAQVPSLTLQRWLPPPSGPQTAELELCYRSDFLTKMATPFPLKL